MKFLPRLAILLTVFVFIFAPQTRAQELNFPRVYEDYLYSFNQYQAAHQDYVGAKSAYQTYQTLTARTEAFDKTLKMLQWRDKTVQTYLSALRFRLAEATGISDYEQTILYLKLDNEIGWYRAHHDKLPSTASPEDLFKVSKEVENQYTLTEILAFQSLASVLTGKIENFKVQLEDEIRTLRTKISEIRQKGDKDTAILDRWLIEAENKLIRAQEKELEAVQIIGTIASEDADKIKKYTNARLKYKEAGQYLIEANHYLLEIVREAKLAD